MLRDDAVENGVCLARNSQACSIFSLPDMSSTVILFVMIIFYNGTILETASKKLAVYSAVLILIVVK